MILRKMNSSTSHLEEMMNCKSEKIACVESLTHTWSNYSIPVIQ